MKKLASALCVLTVLSACATYNEDDGIIPKSELQLEEVYDQFIAKNAQSEHARKTLTDGGPRSSLTFDPYLQTNNIKPTYRKLPNPTLYIYFPPAINDHEGIPTPGWMTEINMYASDHYALPGEMSVGANDE